MLGAGAVHHIKSDLSLARWASHLICRTIASRLDCGPWCRSGQFALDRVKALAPQHPEWKDKEPFASLLKGGLKGALAGGEPAIFEIMTVTHSGMTTDEFEKIVQDWITTAKHPKTGKLYSEMVYQPMIELLGYLRANGFKTFIVSGGGIDFMRVFAERVYGIPPEQIVGSSGKLEFELRDGKPVLLKLPALNFNDDKGGKPVGIQMHIGRRPILAFGNSDGISRCSNGPREAAARASWALCITPTPRANGRTIATPHRPPRQGSRRGEGQGLDRREHEGRLEAHLCVREVSGAREFAPLD